jgi:PAS domain S-box-containing protein
MTSIAHILVRDVLLSWHAIALGLVAAATVALVCSNLSRRRLRRAFESNLRDQARLRAVLTQTPAILWTVDRDLVITSSEGAGLELVGLKPGQVVGMTLQEYFGTHDPTYQPLAIHFEALNGHTGNYEIDYGARTYLVHCEPLRDADGQISGVVVAAVDITVSKQAARDLARSEAKNRALLTAIPDVMFSMTRGGRIVEFVDNLLAPADNFGKTVLELFPATVANQFLATAARVLDTRRAETMEYQTATPGAAPGDPPRFFEARVVNCCDDEVLVILRNITQRKRAENDLRRRETELRSLVRAIPDLIFQLTPDGRFAGCVTPTPDDLLMPPDQFLGRHVHEVLPAHVAALVTKHLRAAVQTGQTQVVQYALDLPAGTRWFEARLVFGGEGTDHVTAVVRNITDSAARSYLPAVSTETY